MVEKEDCTSNKQIFLSLLLLLLLLAEFLSMVCSDVEIEPVLQDISGEHLNRGSNKAQDARLDIHARGFWVTKKNTHFVIFSFV